MYLSSFLLVCLSVYPPISEAFPTKPINTSPRQVVDNTPIQVNYIQTGYVAFGDSFSAGIGTGITETSGCRQGQYSFPKQLLRATTPQAEFQNLACSGAKIENVLQGGEDSQIDAWDPTNSDVGTITIGGNNVGFYNVLTACILRVGWVFAGDCDKEIQDSRQIMQSSGFQDSTEQMLRQIMDKATRPEFQLYLVAYPTFFNEETISCEDVTFMIWNPHRKSNPWENDGPYLTQDLRQDINGLTRLLNLYLSQIVEKVNDDLNQGEGRSVHFVDPNNAYDGHRFCDVDSNGGEVSEPDRFRLDTWFFLNKWQDNGPGAADSAAQELDALAQPIPALPAPEVACTNSTDWGDRITCDISIVAYETNSVDSSEVTLVLANDTIKHNEGDYEDMQVPWYVPTRAAKSFHPRTLGHTAIKDAILAYWGVVL